MIDDIISEIEKFLQKVIDFIVNIVVIMFWVFIAWLLLKLGSFFLDKISDKPIKEKLPTVEPIKPDQQTQLKPSVDAVIESAERISNPRIYDIKMESYPNINLESYPVKVDKCYGEWKEVTAINAYAYEGDEIRKKKNDKSNTVILKQGTKVCLLYSNYPPYDSEYEEKWSRVVYSGERYWIYSGNIR